MLLLRWTILAFLLSGFFIQSARNETSSKTLMNRKKVDSEALFFWDEGQRALKQERYCDAAHFFEKKVNQYPASENRLNSLFFIGKTLFHCGKIQESMRFLQDYVDASQNNLNSIEARLLLGKAYLKLNRPFEAELLSDEIEKKSVPLSSSSGSGFFLLENLLFKAEIFIFLKEKKQAAHILNALMRKIDSKMPKTLSDKIFELSLKLKINKCNEMLPSAYLNEEEMLSLMNQRGFCLLEASLIYKKQILNGKSKISKKNLQSLYTSIEEYKKTCTQTPLGFIGTKKQKKNYQNELADRLNNECKEKIKNITLFIKERNS